MAPSWLWVLRTVSESLYIGRLTYLRCQFGCLGCTLTLLAR